MRLSKTISRLSKIRKNLNDFMPEDGADNRLSDLAPLSSNPGNLRGRFYLPTKLRSGAPLVVVLHGCTQSAAGYDHGSGWSRLADRQGFALLFPEQRRDNNPYLCFNWFEPGDIARGGGEAASIAAMVEAMTARHELNSNRVFVTGLSAGGAMAAVMLAAYPELFAGGAIIAGLPYGCAANVAQAFGCMGGRNRLSARQLGARVRAASGHEGPWPQVSVWQGDADRTVAPGNAEALIRQWANVHGLAARPSRSETVDGHSRRVWLGSDGAELIEQYTIAGMAHGTPLAPGTEPGQSGAAGAHMLDVGLSSTDRIAAFWGIAPAPPQRKAAPSIAPPPRKPRPRRRQKGPAEGVQQVIEDALRAAGLMR